MKKGKILSTSVLGAYLLIAFEFFYMASPFAGFFYSIYKPGLSFINEFPQIAWLGGFFLPHIVENTNSAIINSLRNIGLVVMLIGLLAFVVCAFQVYYSKIFKKGMVSGGLYQYIRHPQYTAFALSGFGMLLVWPRYLALIMFITLLFVYYLLAKKEEKECEQKFGESYMKYKEKTSRFLPIPIKSPISVSSRLTQSPFFLVATYFFMIIASLFVVEKIKEASINSLPTYAQKNGVYISVHNPSVDLEMVANVLEKEVKLESRLWSHIGNDGAFLSYVLPVDMYVSEIPMRAPKVATSHVYRRKYNDSIYKIITTKSISPANASHTNSKELIANTIRIEPLYEIWLDITKQKIIKYFELSPSDIRYPNIPEPVF